MPFPLLTPFDSPRLTIRPVRADDLTELHEVNGDARVTAFLPYPTWQSADDGRAWLARMEALASAGTGRQFVLARQSDGKVIGTLLLFRYDEPSRRVELGYALGHAHWGRGYMREAVEAVCGEAFDRESVRRIEAEVNPANVASSRLLIACGFVVEGRLRQRWVAHGVPYDTDLYGCLADDWRHHRADRSRDPIAQATSP
jgi:ribosomal-protein-alanine N-acetyltransferase